MSKKKAKNPGQIKVITGKFTSYRVNGEMNYFWEGEDVAKEMLARLSNAALDVDMLTDDEFLALLGQEVNCDIVMEQQPDGEFVAETYNVIPNMFAVAAQFGTFIWAEREGLGSLNNG